MTTYATPVTVIAAEPVVQRRRRPPARVRAKYVLTVLVFLLPSLIPLLAFVIGPMISAAWTSLHSWNLIGPMQWVGLDNYAYLLSDPATHQAFLHTVYYIVGYLPLVYVGGLALALALNSRLRGRAVFRGVYFLPVITSWVVVALVWRWLLSPSNGVVNTVLSWVGIEGPGWWADPAWAMPSIILASAWKDLGFVMVILLAGLQTINPDLYEAAELDGAGWWRRLRSITLPLLSPSTFFVIVLSLINGFQVFDQVYVMTGGGPNDASRVVVQQVYDLTFRYGQAGMASALSWLLFFVILVITLIQFYGQKKWVNYE
ncbi:MULTISPECIES: carbohydrate ABC transporter permease [Microbacterium]|jgi:multiple sugar transport system permease protein|uniref:carbohydrate ABC transporter permease n=1 Tax=Microbacterium TaxID=33882 RepID=UPI00248E5DA2|nr:sugar ABC transporter permease [Microbacterium aurum]MBZ6371760.1 sugar ABC transporter permease [Microbacterium hominis]